MFQAVRWQPVLLSSCFLSMVTAFANAQTPGPYPNRALRLIVPTAPGGAADTLARVVAQKLTDSWAQQVVVDARAGANGNIGAELLAKSEPDGYTLMMGTIGVLAINKSLYEKMGYDQLRDFAAVGQLVTFSLLLVATPNQPFTTIPELIAHAKANPGKLNYGSPGTGGSPHMAMELFARMADIKLVHVPYKGLGPAITDLIGGQIQLVLPSPDWHVRRFPPAYQLLSNLYPEIRFSNYQLGLA